MVSKRITINTLRGLHLFFLLQTEDRWSWQFWFHLLSHFPDCRNRCKFTPTLTFPLLKIFMLPIPAFWPPFPSNTYRWFCALCQLWTASHISERCGFWNARLSRSLAWTKVVKWLTLYTVYIKYKLNIFLLAQVPFSQVVLSHGENNSVSLSNNYITIAWHTEATTICNKRPPWTRYGWGSGTGEGNGTGSRR